MAKCLLITRPEEQARRTAEKIEALGFQTMIYPLLEEQYLHQSVSLDDVDGAILTSQMAAIILENSVAPDLRARFPVLCVGSATANIVRRAGFDTTHSASGNVHDLAAEAHTIWGSVSDRPKSIVYLRAESTAHDLSELLADAPFNLVETIVYRMVPVFHFSEPVQQALIKGELSGVLLYSKRTAETFWRLLRNLEKSTDGTLSVPPLYCLSDQIASVFPGDGHTYCKIAAHPDEESMLALLQD